MKKLNTMITPHGRQTLCGNSTSCCFCSTSQGRPCNSKGKTLKSGQGNYSGHSPTVSKGTWLKGFEKRQCLTNITPEKDWTVAENSSMQFISPYTDITESCQAILQQSLGWLMTVNATFCPKPNGMCHVYYKNTEATARAYQFSQTESVLVWAYL